MMPLLSVLAGVWKTIIVEKVGDEEEIAFGKEVSNSWRS